MEFIEYSDVYKEQVINLILDIQNNEAKINLSLDEQPDLKDINNYYIKNGGVFFLAVDNGNVAGTIGLMMRENNCAILKKFFVKSEYRSKKIGLRLYLRLLEFAKKSGVKYIVLDTPSVAKASHKFYERAGFCRVEKTQLPIDYDYPDRKSFLYILSI